MKLKFKNLSKNTLLFMLNSFGTKIISFLLVPLYTYMLTTEEYGLIDLITTTVYLLIPIFTLNIQDAVLRFVFDNDAESDEVMSSSLRFITISFVILAGITYIVHVLNIFKFNEEVYIYFLIIYFITALNNNMQMYLKAMEQIKVIVIGSIVTTFVMCISNIVFLVIFNMGIDGYLIANILGSTIGIFIYFFYGKVYVVLQHKWNYILLKKMIMYSSPLIINSLMWWINNASDRYILSFFMGKSSNGIYSISYKIPTLLVTIQTVFYNAWSISAIKEFDKDDEDGFLSNTYMMYAAVLMFSCSLILIANKSIARMIYSKDFYIAWKNVPFLLLGTMFNGLALFEGCIYTAVKKTKSVSITTVIGAVFNIIFNFILIPICGALGAALSTMIGYVVVFCVRTVGVKKIVCMKITWVRQVISMLLLLVQVVIATMDLNIAFQFIIFAFLIFFNINEIKDIIVKLKDK